MKTPNANQGDISRFTWKINWILLPKTLTIAILDIVCIMILKLYCGCSLNQLTPSKAKPIILGKYKLIDRLTNKLFNNKVPMLRSHATTLFSRKQGQNGFSFNIRPHRTAVVVIISHFVLILDFTPIISINTRIHFRSVSLILLQLMASIIVYHNKVTEYPNTM